VGDKLYVFTREGGNEVIRCLDVADGKEIWQDKYDTGGATGPASGFAGPRSCPAVADGKVVTLGVRGILSCYDAVKGTKLWRNDDSKGSVPTFFTSSSPIVADGLCIVQFGGDRGGGIAAYELANGKEKWKWTGDGTAYASPALLTADGTKALVAETAGKIVALGVADGKLLWETPFAVGGGGGKMKGKGGRGYNAASPMVEGQMVIYSGSGRGATAVQLAKQGDALAAKELWSNKDNSTQYNTPVYKDGLMFGISERDNLFCVGKDGKTAWTAESGGRRGYGSVVDAGAVLLALTPSGQLIVFEPSDKEFKQIAKYKVADGDTYAYPILAGNRLFIKDKDSVTLWTIE
jgi:outer membrane protein assembly factor BamB